MALSFREDGGTPSVEDIALAAAGMVEAIVAGLSTVWRAVIPNRPHPVGMLEVRFHRAPPLGDHYLIGRLVVEEEYRHRGVAWKLLRAGIGAIEGEDATIVFQSMGALPRSYVKLGAKPVAVIGAGSLKDARKGLGLDG